jgi:hypothetical protein
VVNISRLNDSIPHVTKQLQILWHRTTVQLLFEDLKTVTELDKEVQSKEQNRKGEQSTLVDILFVVLIIHEIRPCKRFNLDSVGRRLSKLFDK